jgi:glycosyltransferase involved in cell wall biosynthesis
MYKGKTVCVVVPAYNEEKLIGRVLETMPDYVDKVVVVDDKSTDRTVEMARRPSFAYPLHKSCCSLSIVFGIISLELSTIFGNKPLILICQRCKGG